MADYDPIKERDRWMALLESAQDELVDSIKKREALDQRIGKLQEDISHLAALCGVPVEEDPLKQAGLTDAIRYVIGRAKSQGLTAAGVRSALVSGGYDISGYRNVMASIHTVIKRLLKKKEIRPALFSFDGDSAYVWARGLTPPPPLPESLRKRLK